MTFKDIAQKLARCLSKTNDQNITEDMIRIWRCGNEMMSESRIKNFLLMYNIGGPKTKFDHSYESDPDVDNNTGVKFPGT